jgi:hypothetical protein
MLKNKVILKRKKVKNNFISKSPQLSNNNNSLTKSKKLNFLENYNLISGLEQLLANKSILCNAPGLVKINSHYKIQVYAFYRTKSLLKYRRKMKSDSDEVTTLSPKNAVDLFFERNSGNIELVCLNRQINKDYVKKDYGFYRRYKHQLFTRNYNLWLDFIKATNLVIKKVADVSVLLNLFGLLFKHLNKRRHGRFKQFVTGLFDHILKTYSKDIKGLKLMVSGRLSAKPRSSISKIERGTLNLTCKDANVHSTQMHVYTIYGAFGLKLYINYQK